MAQQQFVVLGGGVSGLSLAYFLRRQQPRARIRVLEGAARAGGWVHTANRGGFLFEEGPRGFRPSRNGAEMLRLKLPTSVREALSWPLTAEVVKAGVHELFTKPTSLADESVYDFAARRFSPVVAERLLDPVASGIFGGDIRYLSVRACFKLLWDLEHERGSVVRGMLFGGSAPSPTLLDGSAKSAFVRGLETAPAGSAPGFTVEVERAATGEREQLPATRVFSTLPAFRLAPVVAAAYPALARTLAEIKFVSMGMAHVGFNERVLESDGFGYLVPSIEREKVVGVVFDSNAFPSQNAGPDAGPQTRLSVMSGGAHFPAITSLSTDELEQLARDAVRHHLRIAREPDFVRSVVLPDCIPQYHVGFHDTLARLEQQLAPGLHLGGNSFYGVGLADCVTRSKELALALAQ
ncbi:hypothetical protein PybrP1_005820 [[Pythium] brassicae (nom. inval.)]|nr:hypothetical protein PybrP1_005820 [[Pythium] brassicae (nom. inval.)]